MSAFDSVQLEVKDRINFAQLMEISLKSLETAYGEDDFKFSKVQKITRGFHHRIPVFWMDVEYLDDVENCLMTVNVDIRPTCCGIPLDRETCKAENIPMFKTQEYVDYERLQQAIINLLDRRAMLVRKEKIEWSTGKNLKGEEMVDLADVEFNEEESQ